MATQEEAAAKLEEIAATNRKISAESSAMIALIQELQSAAQGNVPDDIMAKINEVAGQAKAIDDLVPDAPTP